MIPIIDGRTKLNQPLVKGVRDGGDAFIHDHIGLTIGPLEIDDVALK